MRVNGLPASLAVGNTGTYTHHTTHRHTHTHTHTLTHTHHTHTHLHTHTPTHKREPTAEEALLFRAPTVRPQPFNLPSLGLENAKGVLNVSIADVRLANASRRGLGVPNISQVGYKNWGGEREMMYMFITHTHITHITHTLTGVPRARQKDIHVSRC